MKTTGLSLAEAYNSGRKYRRSAWRNYQRFGYSSNVCIADAVATDYELEPIAKLLTREEVILAVRHAAQHNSSYERLAHNLATEVCDALFGEEK